ncbi:MAG: serine/threonine protein kinase [Peptostreptococcaceae bacterium]|nr:serine/threonine protein kinase [Peptostreptococcaceae bacterium]
MDIPDIKSEEGKIYTDFSFYAKGGMGEIYKGIEKETKQDVVVKLIIIENVEDEELLMREIRISQQISHSHIVRTLATGRLEIESYNYLYIVQDFYINGNARRLIKKEILLEECYRLMMEILDGLQELHKKIVHRDLKPENILVDEENHLAISDFGLAKYIDEKTRTRSFKGCGTIPYMAPECWTGDTNTIAMDIYSLGILFFEILTGQLPFFGKSETEWKDFHIYSAFPDIENYRNDVPTKLKEIILKMTKKRPSERYSSVNEIINSIHETIRLSREEDKEIELLASLGNRTSQAKTIEKLKLAEENKKTAQYIKLLHCQVEELLKKFIDVAGGINERLENDKITIDKKPYRGDLRDNTLVISFHDKAIVISFMDYDKIELYEERARQAQLTAQRANFGFIINEPQASFLKKNNVVLVGTAETNFRTKKYTYGFNLLLCNVEGSIYGEWRKMQFSENIDPPESAFGINVHNFFNEYSHLLCNPFYSYTFEKLKDNDIRELIKKILA